jgi:uncharacterized membrane protein YbhN (UPF0104 family)
VEIAGQVMVFMPTGDLARVAMVRETGASGRGVGHLTGTIAFQELLYMTLIGLGVLPQAFSRRDVALLVLAMTLAHAAIFVILLWEPAHRWAVRTVERVRVLRRFDAQMRQIRPAFLQLVHPRVMVPAVALTGLAVALSFLLFWLSLQAIGARHVSFVSAAFVLALGHLISGLSFLPGGVGVFEGLLTVLMASNGVPPSEGAAAGLLYRGFNDILMAGLGAVVGAALRRWSSHGRGERRDRRRPTSRGASRDKPRPAPTRR